MTVRLENFNSTNLEDNIQLDTANQALKFHNGSSWSTLGPSAAGAQSVGLAGATSPLLVETVPLWAATGNTTALSTGVMTSTAIYLTKGTLVTSLGFMSSTTAESNPVHAWAALYSTAATPALIGQSTDDAAHTWAARTLCKFALATPYRVTTTGVHYASLMIAATVPTLLTTIAHATASVLINTGANYGTGAYDRCVTSASALTTTAPSTIASTTVVSTVPYVAVF